MSLGEIIKISTQSRSERIGVCTLNVLLISSKERPRSYQMDAVRALLINNNQDSKLFQ